eukprot:COSAG02_NODE_3068_length_7430_cov_2.999864_1_plen_51_part_00
MEETAEQAATLHEFRGLHSNYFLAPAESSVRVPIYLLLDDRPCSLLQDSL